MHPARHPTVAAMRPLLVLVDPIEVFVTAFFQLRSRRSRSASSFDGFHITDLVVDEGTARALVDA